MQRDHAKRHRCKKIAYFPKFKQTALITGPLKWSVKCRKELEEATLHVCDGYDGDDVDDDNFYYQSAEMNFTLEMKDKDIL